MNLTIFNQDTLTMPLKEITDLLGVRHNDAMAKVEEMTQIIDFGSVCKSRIAYNLAGQTTETYLLDKRQSIAVASRLNTALLMRIIDRWQELEATQQAALPQTHIEAVKAYLATLETIELQKITLAKQLGIIDDKKVLTDDGEEYYSVKRLRVLNPTARLSGKLLARISRLMRIEVREVYSHYDSAIVATYYSSVVAEVYPELRLH